MNHLLQIANVRIFPDSDLCLLLFCISHFFVCFRIWMVQMGTRYSLVLVGFDSCMCFRVLPNWEMHECFVARGVFWYDSHLPLLLIHKFEMYSFQLRFIKSMYLESIHFTNSQVTEVPCVNSRWTG